MQTSHSESTRPEISAISPVEHVAVIGAGIMGRSIALANLQRGIRVTLTDNNSAALAAAADWIREVLRPAANSTPEPRQARLCTVEGISELGDASVVIEAIVENLAVKRRLLEAVSAQTPGSTLLASNTSSLSIVALAAAVDRPERFCGLHFCHPVALRPLVEVSVAPQTSAAALERARNYVQRLGKRPLMTADVPGFAVNRLLFPYLEAAVDLARRGVPFASIESTALEFGMPQGPLAQLDDIGIDVILRAAAGIHRGKYGIPTTSEPLLALYQAGRLGRKSGAGFFRYTGHDGNPEPDPDAPVIIGVGEPDPVGCSLHELTLHLFVPMLAAAADLLSRPVVNTVGEIEMALNEGLGFDRGRRSLFAWGASQSPPTLRFWLERLSLADRAEHVERLIHHWQVSRPHVGNSP